MRKLKIDLNDLELVFGQSGFDDGAPYLDTETGSIIFAQSDLLSLLPDLDKILGSAQTTDEIVAALQPREDLPELQRQEFIDAACVEYATDGRYLEIVPDDPGFNEEYRDMQLFIETVKEGRLRELLEVAIDGRGAFRRFRDVLKRHEQAETEWYQFSEARQHSRIIDWLASHDIEPE